jgi:hypothetical protein
VGQKLSKVPKKMLRTHFVCMALIVNGLRGKKCKTLKSAEKCDKTRLNPTERAKTEHRNQKQERNGAKYSGSRISHTEGTEDTEGEGELG